MFQKTMKSFLNLNNLKIGLTEGARDIQIYEGLGREWKGDKVRSEDSQGEVIKESRDRSTSSFLTTDKAVDQTQESTSPKETSSAPESGQNQ